MNFFETINEIAVLGTAFLMMAVHTVWYSSMLFGKHVASFHDTQENKEFLVRNVVLFLSFLTALAVVGYVVTYAEVLSLSPFILSFYLFAFAAATAVSLLLFEKRSKVNYATHLGFLALFIVGGAYVIGHWPW